jgi:hypothetical protein
MVGGGVGWFFPPPPQQTPLNNTLPTPYAISTRCILAKNTKIATDCRRET